MCISLFMLLRAGCLALHYARILPALKPVVVYTLSTLCTAGQLALYPYALAGGHAQLLERSG